MMNGGMFGTESVLVFIKDIVYEFFICNSFK